MRHLARTCTLAVGIGSLVLAATPAQTGDAPPLAGCYARVYDASHLAKHTGQIVVRATLSIGPSEAAAQQTAAADPIVADGRLKLWVRGHGKSFDSIGACRADGDGLTCLGSLSAAEADTCKSGRDGVRACRVDPTDAGAFRVERRPGGLMVSIRKRLELVPSPYDAGPYLSISASNLENRAFLLAATPDACK